MPVCDHNDYIQVFSICSAAGKISEDVPIIQDIILKLRED